MEWSEEAIVLAARRHGESALIVQLLTRGHGRHAGLVRGGQGPKSRTIYQIGNRLVVTWKARLAQHLGGIAGELLRGPAARFIDHPAPPASPPPPSAVGQAPPPRRQPPPPPLGGLVAVLG